MKVAQGTKVFNSSGKNVGKVISHIGNTGLALLRVQEMLVGLMHANLSAQYHSLVMTKTIA